MSLLKHYWVLLLQGCAFSLWRSKILRNSLFRKLLGFLSVSIIIDLTKLKSAIRKNVETLVGWATVLPKTTTSLLSCSSCLMGILKTTFFYFLYITFAFWQSGKLSRELDLVSHHVRTRLDELKRQEVARLRMLIKAKMDSVQGKDTKLN